MTDERFRALSHALQADPSIAAAIVYGSAARDQLRRDSDLDVAVLRERGGNGVSRSFSLLRELGALGRAAGRDVHLTDLEAVDVALRHTIFASGISLFDRSRGALRRLEHATAIEYADWEYARRIIDASLDRQLGRIRG